MHHHTDKLILASQSPRRRILLSEAGFEFSILPPADHVEEAVDENLPPEQLVVESACLKARYVAREVDEGIVLAADTVAECNGVILGKPKSKSDARRMLQLMSGKAHQVLTGICLWHRPSDQHARHLETTSLRMDVLNEIELEQYLDFGDWEGKAGAFGYQDGLEWVHIEQGLASNVVGLPVERLTDWIRQLRDQARK